MLQSVVFGILTKKTFSLDWLLDLFVWFLGMLLNEWLQKLQ